MAKRGESLKDLASAAAKTAAAIGKAHRWSGPGYEEAAREAARLNDLVLNETLAAIEEAPTPLVRDSKMRCKSRKEWAVAVRALFKDLGIPHVSVTAPVYSMAQSIRISIPSTSHAYHRGYEPNRYDPNSYRNCPRCSRRHAAENRLERLILAAYPDLNNRSDSMTDYFDYCLSIS